MLYASRVCVSLPHNFSNLKKKSSFLVRCHINDMRTCRIFRFSVRLQKLQTKFRMGKK